MKVYRYYTLYRPPAPGSIPRGCVSAKEYGSRPYISEIGHTAWGEVNYDHPLTPKEVSDYELAPANMTQMPIEISQEA